MPKNHMGVSQLRTALESLGRFLEWPSPVELVIVGGAAAILTGLLTTRVTVDCDVVSHSPRASWRAIETAARRVAEGMGLPADWLNAETETMAHRLPEGWRARSHVVAQFGAIRVVAIGRQDLIAMKFIAGRAVDLEDLTRLRVTRPEADFVRAYLRSLAERHPAREAEAVQESMLLLEHGGLVR